MTTIAIMAIFGWLGWIVARELGKGVLKSLGWMLAAALFFGWLSVPLAGTDDHHHH